MSENIQPTILVIVGISGDLSKRKLLPAITRIAQAGILPDDFRIIGITRKNVQIDDVLPEASQDIRNYLEIFQMDLTKLSDYQLLKERLAEIEETFDSSSQRLFYLSIPPQATRPVLEQLGKASLNTPQTKLLLEKPFGTDLESAEELVESIRHYFTEEQTYRIDHYLAKEMAQNLVVFRSSNALFKQTWNKDFIESITIVASEKIGIEGRGAFYEQTGALRDLVQSHLLQLAALTLMELPGQSEWHTIPQKRLHALKHLYVSEDVKAAVTRGQYKTYPQETGNPHSVVETFVRLQLASHDPRWQNVPITIVTGKGMKAKTTEIRIRYKQQHEHEANELALHMQPNEGVTIQLWVKKPGYDRALQQLSLDFAYSNHYKILPGAYERVFADALRSDHSLFATSDEVLASWRILAPIQHVWSMDSSDLIMYETGTDITEIYKP
jgi:glucose-6-phosphate 1-dehydrogenase